MVQIIKWLVLLNIKQEWDIQYQIKLDYWKKEDNWQFKKNKKKLLL